MAAGKGRSGQNSSPPEVHSSREMNRDTRNGVPPFLRKIIQAMVQNRQTVFLVVTTIFHRTVFFPPEFLRGLLLFAALCRYGILTYQPVLRLSGASLSGIPQNPGNQDVLFSFVRRIYPKTIRKQSGMLSQQERCL